LEAITGKHSTDSPHKTAILGTSHMMQPETCSLSGMDHLWFKKITTEKRLVARDIIIIIIIRELASIKFLFINLPKRQSNGQLKEQHNIRKKTNKGKQAGYK
jgi:hypothetical protein